MTESRSTQSITVTCYGLERNRHFDQPVSFDRVRYSKVFSTQQVYLRACTVEKMVDSLYKYNLGRKKNVILVATRSTDPVIVEGIEPVGTEHLLEWLAPGYFYKPGQFDQTAKTERQQQINDILARYGAEAGFITNTNIVLPLVPATEPCVGQLEWNTPESFAGNSCEIYRDEKRTINLLRFSQWQQQQFNT